MFEKVKYIGDILENVAKKNKYVGEKYREEDMLKVGLMYYFWDFFFLSIRYN